MVALQDEAATPVAAQRSGHGIAVRLAAAVFLAGAAAIVIARWWTGTGYVPPPAGLPDPGRLTAITLPVVRLAADAAGMLVVGLLLVRSLMPAALPGEASDRRLGMLAARWSWVWAGATATWVVFTMSDMTGLPLTRLPASADLVVVVSGTQRVLAEVATLWVAVTVALFAGRLAGRAATTIAGCLAVLALLPSALTGHAGHHNETTLTVLALAVHIASAAVWVGGLLAIVLYLRGEEATMATVLPRFSAAALVCAAAVAVSGVVVSVVMLGSWSALADTDRGLLIMVKALALLVLTGVGYLHRRATMPAAVRGNLCPLLRLAGVEVLLMGATIGVAVALSTTP
jgi:putative copper resistance protein D